MRGFARECFFFQLLFFFNCKISLHLNLSLIPSICLCNLFKPLLVCIRKSVRFPRKKRPKVNAGCAIRVLTRSLRSCCLARRKPLNHEESSFLNGDLDCMSMFLMEIQTTFNKLMRFRFFFVFCILFIGTFRSQYSKIILRCNMHICKESNFNYFCLFLVKKNKIV